MVKPKSICTFVFAVVIATCLTNFTLNWFQVDMKVKWKVKSGCQSCWNTTTVRPSTNLLTTLMFRRLPTSTTGSSSEQLAVMSKKMNEQQKRLQQLQCNQVGVHSTDTGAWCKSAVAQLHIFDEPLAVALGKFFEGKSVLSLGEGRGEYRKIIFNTTSKVVRYDAFDGAPFTEESTNGIVKYMDLTLPQYWLPRYNWVVCLEVVEHIPGEFESVVLDNIIRPAVEGVVLSWASPTQPGFGHVNAKTPEQIQAILENRGLRLDISASESLRNASTLTWFKNHISVYRLNYTPVTTPSR